MLAKETLIELTGKKWLTWSGIAAATKGLLLSPPAPFLSLATLPPSLIDCRGSTGHCRRLLRTWPEVETAQIPPHFNSNGSLKSALLFLLPKE